MTTAITVFAWLGFGIFAVLTLATFFVWGVWAWRACLEHGCQMLGMLHATHYYCGLVLNKSRADTRVAAGKLLWARFAHMKEAEPEIAAEFERCLKFYGEPICGGEMRGCNGGPKCTSDHK